MNNLKILMINLAVVGGFFANILGGWDGALKTLITFMVIDYITGVVVAAVFKKSNKSENGALESKAGFKGLCRKCMVLLYVLLAYNLDMFLEISYVRYTVIIGFILNETVSITENAGLMGVPLPSPITKAIEILSSKASQ